jgi:hypothetical protein
MTRSTCPACAPTPLHVGFFVPGYCKPDGFFATISRSVARAPFIRRLGGASPPSIAHVLLRARDFALSGPRRSKKPKIDVRKLPQAVSLDRPRPRPHLDAL